MLYHINTIISTTTNFQIQSLPSMFCCVCGRNFLDTNTKKNEKSFYHPAHNIQHNRLNRLLVVVVISTVQWDIAHPFFFFAFMLLFFPVMSCSKKTVVK